MTMQTIHAVNELNPSTVADVYTRTGAKNRRFTKKEAQLTTTIARARIHVERAIARLKNHQILTFIPKHYRHSATKIFQVCACLVNFQALILKAVEAIGGAESNECDESFTL